MNSYPFELPFVWPDSRRLAGHSAPMPDLGPLFSQSRLILGVVHGLTRNGVRRLKAVLAGEPTTTLGGDKQLLLASAEKTVRLILTLYPTCPTTSNVLQDLLDLQKSYPSLEVKIITSSLFSEPENTIACYSALDATPTLLFGSAANLEDIPDQMIHHTLAFIPEPVLAAEWQNGFDVRWLKAATLTKQRANIPRLVLPEGTPEAAQRWTDYEQLCLTEHLAEEHVEVVVDPTTGEVTAKLANGEEIATVSTENKLPKISPVYRRLSQLLEMGHLVSVDKTTRLLPFEVSVKPKWFGLETLKQIGSVKRQVSYHITALTDNELKQLENRRKKTSELLDLFSFSLADGQRWMPSTAENLFRQENNRINTEAKDILSKLVAGDLDKFMDSRRRSVQEDANRMYRDLFPGQNLSEEAIDEIMVALKKRFEEAQQRSILPQLSFTRVSLPQPQDSAWKSQLGSALHLLLSVVRYPRKASRNGMYFARGMTAKPLDILKAMNVLSDSFLEKFDGYDARDRAEPELEIIEAIEASEMTAEEKCEKLLELVGQAISGNSGKASEEAEPSLKKAIGTQECLFEEIAGDQV